MPTFDPKNIKKSIIQDMKVELTEEFDRNFTRKAFFTDKWKARRNPNANGTLLVVTGTLRRSIQSEDTDSGVRFTSNVPYAELHNEGGKGQVTVRAHTRTRKGKTYNVRSHMRKVNIPRRQFIGDGVDTQRIIKEVVEDNLNNLNVELSNILKK